MLATLKPDHFHLRMSNQFWKSVPKVSDHWHAEDSPENAKLFGHHLAQAAEYAINVKFLHASLRVKECDGDDSERKPRQDVNRCPFSGFAQHIEDYIDHGNFMAHLETKYKNVNYTARMPNSEIMKREEAEMHRGTGSLNATAGQGTKKNEPPVAFAYDEGSVAEDEHRLRRLTANKAFPYRLIKETNQEPEVEVAWSEMS